jgi:hypothetical protein
MSGLAFAFGGSPLNKNEAVQAQLRLQKLEAFVGDHMTWLLTRHLSECKAHSQTFETTCTNKNVSASTCQKWKCSSPSHSSKTACEGNSSSWMQDGDADNSICCSHGKLKCGFNATGQEISCCDACLDPNNPLYATDCTVKDMEGPSICGTEKGKCFQCIGFPDRDSKALCVQGTCNITGHYDNNSCIQANGSWKVGVWEENTTVLSEAMCLKDSYCASCSSPTYLDKDSCKHSGHNWTVAANATSESSCHAKGAHYKWTKIGKFESGKQLPAAPMKKTSCSTGPSHELDGLVDGLSGNQACVTEAKFLQDAASDMTVQEAIDADPFYYKKQVHKSWFARAIVTNSPLAKDRARMTLASTACFVGVLEPKNKGQIKVNGGANTTMLIYKPMNYADADTITVTGAKALVLGGTSEGPIVIDTPKKIEVYGIANSGTINCSGSQDIVIANVTNTANATITVTDVTASLLNVVNDGVVLVKGPVAQGGKYHAFDIVNKGVVTIEAGTIDIHTICPSSGTINVDSGVSGNITYEAGCKGTVNAPSTVTVQEVVKAGMVVTGSLGMSVPDADAFIVDSVALNAVAEGIAETIGVQPAWVSATATKVRRLQGEDDSQSVQGRRRLAGTIVSVSYAVNIPASASSAVVSDASGKLTYVSTAMLTQKVQTKLSAAKSPNYTITVTSKTAPAASKATTTTTTTTTTVTTTTTKTVTTTTGSGTTTMSKITGMGPRISGGVSFAVVNLPLLALLVIFSVMFAG